MNALSQPPVAPELLAIRTKHPHFARDLLVWFDVHGRTHLPWQDYSHGPKNNPYRTWLSEIMLQQTQVATVIPYFEKFIVKFPEVERLATAEQDEVLHLWTGLGYYARARNLHKCAQVITEQHNGVFPVGVEALSELPGIGRSTAGAITSLAQGQVAAILDGNVKRVLARYFAVEGWPGTTSVQKQLWLFAEALTPSERCNHYTQAMMDLGASLCSRTKPDCQSCPLQPGCAASAQGNPENYPGKKPKKDKPVKTVQMLMLQNPAGEIWLDQRPAEGIWGGLWSLPELQSDDNIGEYLESRFEIADKNLEIEHWQAFRHTFSHYHLDIQPVLVRGLELPTLQTAVKERDRNLWYNLLAPANIGLAAPVVKLFEKLKEPRLF